METVVSRFEKIVEKYPDNIALHTKNDGRVTYRELNASANRVAHAVLGVMGEGNDPVVCFYKHGERAYFDAVLGVVKAGKAVVAVNIDKDTLSWGQRGIVPPKHVTDILYNTGAELILCDGEFLQAARILSKGADVLKTDDLPGLETNPTVEISGDDLVSILHTTGTTGAPKAVQRSHRMELYNMDICNLPPIGPNDRVTLFRTANTAAFADMFLALLNGACLCPYDLSWGNVTEWVARAKITYLRGLGTAFRKLEPYERGGGFPHMRLINIGGEMITREDVENYRKHFPDSCRFVVRFSSSEGGTYTHFVMNKNTELVDGVVPVGYPLGDRKIEIVDGEIVIKSAYLSSGYLMPSPEQEAKFPAPYKAYWTGDKGYLMADGCLVHQGRIGFTGRISEATVFNGVRLKGSDQPWTK